MPGKKHTHKYYKTDLGFGPVWACALSDCTHHMPPHYAPLMAGKNTYCWECNSLMTLDPDALNMERPLCLDCRTGSEFKDFLKGKGII